jgi:hypothetical protein
LNSLNFSWKNRQYVADVVKTQMFERFLHDLSSRRKFFDEHIVLRRNQSVWGTTKKQPTPFLDDMSKWKVRQVINPAAPCAIGVQKGRVYRYKSFPRLDEKEFVSSKTVNPWSALCHGALCSAFLSLS